MSSPFEAYVDGSGSGDPDLLVVGGYIAPTNAWEDFSQKWEGQTQRSWIVLREDVRARPLSSPENALTFGMIHHAT